MPDSDRVRVVPCEERVVTELSEPVAALGAGPPLQEVHADGRVVARRVSDYQVAVGRTEHFRLTHPARKITVHKLMP